MSDYWQRRTSTIFQCSDCGGAVRILGGAPIASGYVENFRCIRCGATGSIRDQRGNRRISGDIEGFK